MKKLKKQLRNRHFKSLCVASAILITALMLTGCSPSQAQEYSTDYTENPASPSLDNSVAAEHIAAYSTQGTQRGLCYCKRLGVPYDGVYGMFRMGLTYDLAKRYDIHIFFPHIPFENVEFHGISLHGNMCVLEADSVTLTYSVQFYNELVVLQLSQTYWENSVYRDPDGAMEISAEGVSVFAGIRSGEGRHSVEIVPTQLAETTAFFATPDRRSPPEIALDDGMRGSSLYWLWGETVFTLTVYEIVPGSLVDLDTMIAIANSID